jgi:hypothetical protein
VWEGDPKSSGEIRFRQQPCYCEICRDHSEEKCKNIITSGKWFKVQQYPIGTKKFAKYKTKKQIAEEKKQNEKDQEKSDSKTKKQQQPKTKKQEQPKTKKQEQPKPNKKQEQPKTKKEPKK